MRILRIVSILGFGVVAAFAQAPEDLAKVAQEARETATRSLDTLKQLASGASYKSLGFNSADEAKSAVLGDPTLSYYVRLDRLREYQAGADPNALLAGGGEKIVYPVLIGQDVRSSVILEKSGGAWKAASFGGAAFSKLFFGARAAKQPGAPGGSYFVVSVPALALNFLGSKAGGTFTLESLADDRASGVRAGTVRPAGEVFTSLVPVARAYNGLPR